MLVNKIHIGVEPPKNPHDLWIRIEKDGVYWYWYPSVYGHSARPCMSYRGWERMAGQPYYAGVIRALENDVTQLNTTVNERISDTIIKIEEDMKNNNNNK